jgi:asparagine synthase (glutamine-hydrolysing)
MPERGPDSWNVYETKSGNNFIVMFHSRLSIIGIGDQGRQPFQEIDGKILIFNGEIYNYKTLKDELRQEFNIQFKTETDTEVLYYGLIYWGIDKTLNKINGIFVFSFYDKTNNKFLIARDNLGVKPLYYFHKNDELAISSECKAFFSQNICEPNIRKELLGEYFANLWIYEPNTLFQDIYKLEAGCYMIFENGRLTKKRYWSLNESVDNKPIISEIVKLQMTTSDVKVGAYLSGGIDSSIIAASLKENPITFFNLDLEGEENRRLEHLRELFKLNIIKSYPTFKNLKSYEYLIRQIEEPIADPSIIPSYELAKGAKEIGCTVMLSGMGGDEIDCGYSRSNIIKYISLLKPLVLISKLIPQKIIQFILKDKKYSYYRRLSNFIADITPTNYFALTYYFSRQEIDDLVAYDWYTDYKKRIDALMETKRGIKRFYELDFKGFLASHAMILTDKASMAASVEVRVPLLDKNLVNYFYKDIHKRINSKKRRLRHELRKYIDKENFKVKKEGFIYPIREWLEHEVVWSDIISVFEKMHLLNTSYIKKLVEELYKNKSNDIEIKLWSIYTLFLWIKVFKIYNTTSYS